MAFTVEELDTNSDYDSDMEVVQPSQIEDAKSDSSCSALEDQWPFEEVRGQATWESSDEGEEDVRIYRRKKKRWDAGIFKRSLSQNFETDSSHSDYDPLDGSKSSARRIRRRFRGPGELSSPVLEEILYSKAANSAKVENLEDVAYIKGLPANPSDDGFGLEGLPFRFLGDQMMESEDGENNLESEEKEENSLPNYRSTHCSTSEDPLQKIPSKSTAEIEHDSQMSATKFQLSLLGYLLIEINLGPIVQSLQYSIARLRHFLQPSIPAGYTRISWTCVRVLLSQYHE